MPLIITIQATPSLLSYPIFITDDGFLYTVHKHEIWSCKCTALFDDCWRILITILLKCLKDNVLGNLSINYLSDSNNWGLYMNFGGLYEWMWQLGLHLRDCYAA